MQTILTKVKHQKGQMVDIEKEIVAELKKEPYGLEPEMVHFFLVVLTTLGKVALKGRGGDEIDITNIKEKFKSISQFENIVYVVKKEDLSYDFAQNLLNALGLNGSKMLQEKTRNDGFTDYKKKIEGILKDIKTIELLIPKLESKTTLYLNIDSVKGVFDDIQSIDWNALDISQHVKFKKIEALNIDLTQVSRLLALLENLKTCLQEYYTNVHKGIDYMSDALEILKSNKEFLEDEEIENKLGQYYFDTLAIVKDFNKFIQLSERFPIAGKIQAFKDTYVKEFYLPALHNTIGKNVNWIAIENYKKHPLFHKTQLLADANCNVKQKLQSKINLWDSLLKLRNERVDVDRLYDVPFDTASNFMKVERNYKAIDFESKSIDKTIENIYQEYANITVSEVKKKAGQLDMVKIPEEQKQKIKQIIDTDSLTDDISPYLIDAINKLFVDIKVIKLNKEEIAKELFKQDELLTFEQIRKSFFDVLNRLEQQKGDETRFKID